MTHAEIKDFLAFAALDRLTPDEIHALEAHLREGCAECPADLAEYREAVGSIAFALEPAATEDRIWNSLQSRLAATVPQAVRGTSGSQMREAGGRRASGRIGMWRAATAAAAAAAIVLAVYAGVLTSQVHRIAGAYQQEFVVIAGQVTGMRGQLDSARAQVATLEGVLNDRHRLDRVLLSPDLRLIRLDPLPPAPQASALVAISEARHAAMIQALKLPPTPAGKTYELWWITRQSGPVKAGLFTVAKENTVIAPASPPPAGEHLQLSAVTLEPAGGVSKPTGSMYLKGAPAYE